MYNATQSRIAELVPTFNLLNVGFRKLLYKANIWAAQQKAVIIVGNVVMKSVADPEKASGSPMQQDNPMQHLSSGQTVSL